MTYTTPEPKKILVADAEGYSQRFYPYPKDLVGPSGVSPIARSAPGFGFIVLRQQAIYGNNLGGAFSPTRQQ